MSMVVIFALFFCLLDVTSIDMNVAETVLYVTWHQ